MGVGAPAGRAGGRDAQPFELRLFVAGAERAVVVVRRAVLVHAAVLLDELCRSLGALS